MSDSVQIVKIRTFCPVDDQRERIVENYVVRPDIFQSLGNHALTC